MKEKIESKDKSKGILTIYSDSQYMINSITVWIHKWKFNQWRTANGKPVKNKDLIYQLDHLINLYKDFLTVEFKFVKAHRRGKDIPKNKTSLDYKHWYGNMMADKLAKRGSTIALKAME